MSTAWAKPSKARAPPRASRKGCSEVSQSAGHVPTKRSSRSAQMKQERDHQRPSAAQPTGDASQVSAQRSDFSSPERRAAYAEEATRGHSDTPSGP
jgi:hypothetical protein